ncbi:MAG: 50S ribosomal protein L5 [Nitrososphaerota archaeon]|nr:50S ribosomal protein L5 [Nitrososphaerota archaeon]MDG6939508.1 50S ribosomal protein L5 [Nitrososphaerota archaeon]
MSAVAEQKSNPMTLPRLAKVTLNIAVGKPGEQLEKARKVLEILGEQKPSPREAKSTIRDFGIHKGESIAVLVTLRKEKAKAVLKKLLQAKGNAISASSFDELGNVSFGIKEHIEIQGMKYDPEIGIFGMDVSVSLEKPGVRVQRRRRASCSIPLKQRVSKAEAQEFFRTVLGAEVR